MEQLTLEQSGFLIIPGFLDNKILTELRETTLSIQSVNARNLLKDYPAIRAFAVSTIPMNLARQILGPSVRAVKATYFNKIAEANWKVPPHQDVTIAVKNKCEVPGFGPWTIKAGVNNVQPPPETLEQMVAFRFHLDDCGVDNGALRVWPGSHCCGRLGDEKLKDHVGAAESTLCPVPMGGLMVMRPLLVHASSPSVHPDNRRVIHIEYTGCDLPGGLRWLDEIHDGNVAI